MLLSFTACETLPMSSVLCSRFMRSSRLRRIAYLWQHMYARVAPWTARVFCRGAITVRTRWRSLGPVGNCRAAQELGQFRCVAELMCLQDKGALWRQRGKECAHLAVVVSVRTNKWLRIAIAKHAEQRPEIAADAHIVCN